MTFRDKGASQYHNLGRTIEDKTGTKKIKNKSKSTIMYAEVDLCHYNNLGVLKDPSKESWQCYFQYQHLGMQNNRGHKYEKG